MKNIYSLSFAALIAAMTLTTACSKQDSEQGGGQGFYSTALAKISHEPNSRVVYEDQIDKLNAAWEIQDQFKAFGTQKIGNKAVYTAQSINGKQASFDGTWSQKLSKNETLYAVSPFDKNSSEEAYSVNLTGQTGLLKDLKQKSYMRAKTTYRPADPISFFFSYRVAVLKLELTFPEIENGEATKVGISAPASLSYAATLDLTIDDGGTYYSYMSKGKDITTGSNVLPITNHTLTAYLCLFPEELSDVSVVAIVDGISYKATLNSKNTLVEGKMYTVKKTMAKEKYWWYKKNKKATNFELADVIELKELANLVNGKDYENSGESAPVTFIGKTVTLKENTTFDLNNEEWTPIGGETGYISFHGTFDGNGNTISGLQISNSSFDYVGLFGHVMDGGVKNIKLDGGTISATGYATGSIAGCIYTSTIENCSSSANVSGLEAGGIVGMLYGSKMTACYATGNVTGGQSEGAISVGGLLGSSSGGSQCRVCYYTQGTVTGGKGKNCMTAGVVGTNHLDSYMNNCYSTGTIIPGTATSITNTGGIIGSSQKTTKNLAYLVYVTGKGATVGIGDQLQDDITIVQGVNQDNFLTMISWLNTGAAAYGWQFNDDGTLKKVE